MLAHVIAPLPTTAAGPTSGATSTNRAGTAIQTVIVPIFIAAMGGFVVDDIRQTRGELTAAINANTARLEAPSARTTALGERLTRVATLIQERLPPPLL